MENIFTFHKTVLGYSHVKRNIPCEDSSASYYDENLGFQIIVVCDGHGDPACARSAYGSKALAEVTLNCLKEYASSIAAEESYRETNREELLIPRTQDMIIRRLTDIILSRWCDVILKNLDENPLTQEEIDASGKYQAFYQAGEKLEHIYGTTLIAALHMDDLLILLQQGDGRCDVFYEDGSVDQPIPWDDRCFENVTTSMCDEDANVSIRHCVVNLREKPVIACFMGSDGVEDSYMNMEGTHSFYRALCCKIVENGTDALDEYLEGYLPDFSEDGSGDDVSVAGIVDLEAIKDWADKFEIWNRQYEIDSSSTVYRTKLVSMERKHTHLEKKLAEAERKVKANKAAYEQLEDRRNEVAKKLKAIEDNIAEEEKNLEDSEKAKSKFDESSGTKLVAELQKVLGAFRNESTEKISQLQKRQGEGTGILARLKEKITSSQGDIDEAIAEYEKVKAEYDEYHAKYMNVVNELEKLERIKASLESGISGEEEVEDPVYGTSFENETPSEMTEDEWYVFGASADIAEPEIQEDSLVGNEFEKTETPVKEEPSNEIPVPQIDLEEIVKISDAILSGEVSSEENIFGSSEAEGVSYEQEQVVEDYFGFMNNSIHEENTVSVSWGADEDTAENE